MGLMITSMVTELPQIQHVRREAAAEDAMESLHDLWKRNLLGGIAFVYI